MQNHHPMIIGSEQVNSQHSIEVRSPYDGRLLGTVPEATTEHIDAAIANGLETLSSNPLATHERAEILDRLATSLLNRSEEFAQSISAEAGKPIASARVEAARAVDTSRFSAAVARTLGGDVITMDASATGIGKTGFIKRVPIGVVGAITPFNFPLNLVCHKVAPAIAAGCPVVLKPASATPLTALLLGRVLLEDCGLPPGWVNVVTCPGGTADHMVTHDDVAMITFTGSPDVGWKIRARALKKKVSLELGNNSPIVIEPDIDPVAVASRISTAAFAYAGQTCISTQRLYVHVAIAEKFIEALTTEASKLVLGDPADPKTDVSSLIDITETNRVLSWVDEATANGAQLVCGGKVDNGVILPTILTEVAGDMKVSCVEIFGPVVGISTYENFEDALRRANDTNYGLQAAVFTHDLDKALRAADALRFGAVMVNEVPSWRADHMPYGGIRDSGNTREGPAYTIREMTEERLIVIQT